MPVVISLRQECVAQWGESTRFVAAEMIGEDQVQRGTGFRFILIVPVWAVPAATAGYLFCGQTEKKEVVLTRFFSHFDGSAATRADRQGSVHHELHVAGAAGFVTSSRDLVGNIGGGDQALGKRHAVLRQEDNLQPAADRRVAVDRAGKIV